MSKVMSYKLRHFNYEPTACHDLITITKYDDGVMRYSLNMIYKTMYDAMDAVMRHVGSKGQPSVLDICLMSEERRLKMKYQFTFLRESGGVRTLLNRNRITETDDVMVDNMSFWGDAKNPDYITNLMTMVVADINGL